jgi:hypothetical protein
MAKEYKLTDVRNINIVVPTGGAVVNPAVDLTHDLKDQNGNLVNPDEVHLELISAAGVTPNMCLRLRITRPGSPNGKVTLNGQVAAANASGGNWTYTFRAVSKFYHSIQSNVH